MASAKADRANAKKKKRQITRSATAGVKLAEKDLEAEVKRLEKTFGMLKIDMIDCDGDSEGVWATPADEESMRKLKSNTSAGEFAYVRLMNKPLFWSHIWGGLLRVKTHAGARPTAVATDQDDKVLQDRELWINRLYPGTGNPGSFHKKG